MRGYGFVCVFTSLGVKRIMRLSYAIRSTDYERCNSGSLESERWIDTVVGYELTMLACAELSSRRRIGVDYMYTR